MPAFDALLMTRTTGNLTVSESGGPLTIRGTGIKGMAARVAVPTAFHDDDTLQVNIYTSPDASTYTKVGSSEVVKTFKANPRDVIVPLVSIRKYVKVELVVTSTTAANINFGAVKAGMVTGVGFDWSRAVSFE